ncbi:MAG TPA: ABC transporter permease [Gemmatimonadaceae bacterium]|nr:ABC transporter permease [Gemmatimonadaceae bacterium]
MKRLRSFFRRPVESDVDDELRFHLAMREREFADSGMEEAAAREAALRRFGNVERVRALCTEIGHQREREMRRAEFVDTLRQDLRFATRQLVRSPGFALAAVVALALGIGANATLFALVDAVLLRPLPGVVAAERLVEGSSPSISYPAYVDFRDRVRTLAGLAGFREREMALGDGAAGAAPEVVTGVVATGNYFAVLGARAALGRTFAPPDDAPGAPPVAVVSDGFWRRRLGADPAAVGRTIVLNGAAVTVVGVAERGFRGTHVALAPDVWVPVAAWPHVAPGSMRRMDVNRRGWGWVTTVARLAPGATIGQAQAEMDAEGARQLAAYPRETDGNPAPRLYPATVAAAGPRGARGAIVGFSTVLFGIVALVLLVACASVANLLLARAARRRREMGVRLSLGAGRGRLVRQLLTESLLLAALAGAVALGATVLAMRAIGRVTVADGISLGALGLEMDARVIAFTTGLALFTGLAFGLAPAWRASRVDVITSLKAGSGDAGGGGGGGGRGRAPGGRLRGGLVVVQVALSLVLLVGAGLFARGLQRALSLDTGYRALDQVALAGASTGLTRWDAPRAAQFYRDVVARLEATPGVRAAAWTEMVPLSGEVNRESIGVPGYVPRPRERMSVELNIVGAHYFDAVGLAPSRGRVFDAAVGALINQGPPEAVVNESMAKRYWPTADAVGQQLRVMGLSATVVGVVPDARYHRLDEDARPYLYLSLEQAVAAGHSPGTIALVVRAAGGGGGGGADPEQIVPVMLRELAAAGPEVPVIRAGAFADHFGQLLAPQRIAALVLGLFSALALLIAAVGISGIVAYAVAQRTREIGIRMALGARPAAVVRLVLAGSVKRVLLGVAIGLALATALGRAAQGFLYGVSATDALTFSATALLLLVVGAVAALLPARRATRVDPAQALRSE